MNTPPCVSGEPFTTLYTYSITHCLPFKLKCVTEDKQDLAAERDPALPLPVSNNLQPLPARHTPLWRSANVQQYVSPLHTPRRDKHLSLSEERGGSIGWAILNSLQVHTFIAMCNYIKHSSTQTLVPLTQQWQQATSSIIYFLGWIRALKAHCWHFGLMSRNTAAPKLDLVSQTTLTIHPLGKDVNTSPAVE